jgi:hypothetical protein
LRSSGASRRAPSATGSLPNPRLLPPVTRIPDLKGSRWTARIVRAWLDQYAPLPTGPNGPRRRGRPRKVDQMRLSEGLDQ